MKPAPLSMLAQAVDRIPHPILCDFFQEALRLYPNHPELRRVAILRCCEELLRAADEAQPDNH